MTAIDPAWVLIAAIYSAGTAPVDFATITHIGFHTEQACQGAGKALEKTMPTYRKGFMWVCQSTK